MANDRFPAITGLDSNWWRQQTRVRDGQLWWLSVAGILWMFVLFLNGMVESAELTTLKNASYGMSEARAESIVESRRLTGELSVIVRLLNTLGFAIIGVQFARFLLKERKRHRPASSLSTRMFLDSPCAMVVSDADDVVLDVNPAYERLTGYRRHEVIGMPISFNHTGQTGEDEIHHMRQRLLTQGTWEGQFWLRSRSGGAFAGKVLRRVFHDRRTDAECVLTVSMDSASSEEEKRLMLWQAHHDTLTKLPNHNLFQERFTRVVMNLKSEIARCRAQYRP